MQGTYSGILSNMIDTYKYYRHSKCEGVNVEILGQIPDYHYNNTVLMRKVINI